MNGAPQLPRPGLLAIAQQVYCDLFGKDVQSTGTASYTWVADQWGHLGLGFVLTTLAHQAGVPAKLACLAVVAVFAAKEWGDFQREKAKKSASSGLFEIDFKLLWWNIVVAWFYIAVGAIGAVLLITPTRLKPGPTGLFLVAACLVMAFSWLQQKLCFQQAGLPFLYRLSSFPRRLTLLHGGCANGAACAVRRFANPRQTAEQRQHLVISGPRGCGRTSLACGIATEFTFKLGTARYLTAAKLLELLEPPATTHDRLRPPDSEQQEFDDGRVLWRWDRVDLLVLDDVAAWPPPAPLLQAVTRCAARRVVWVVATLELAPTDLLPAPDAVTALRLD